MSIHVSIIKLNAYVSLWNMCSTPCICVHVYLYTTLMHMSTNSGVTSHDRKISQVCIMWAILEFIGFLCRQEVGSHIIPSDHLFLLVREPHPKAESIGAEGTSQCRQVPKTVGLKLWDWRRHQSPHHLRKMQGLSDIEKKLTWF